MRILIIPDATMVLRERGLLARLAIGLADEGIRVMQGSPRSLAGHEAADALAHSVFARSVPYDDTGLPLTGRLRAKVLMRDLMSLLQEEPGAEGIDAVFATGDASWGIAREVARGMGASLVFEVFAARQVPRAAALWRRDSAETSAVRPWFVVAGESLGAMLRQHVPTDRTITAPWGVHGVDVPRPPLSEEPTVAILASGSHPPVLRFALEALASVAHSLPGLHVLIDAQLTRSLPIWQWAGGTPGMRERLSIIAELDGRHDVLTSADLLLVPEPLGEHRSVILQAMADGMLVAAAPDPCLDWLVPDVSAAVFESGTLGISAESIRSLLIGPRGLLSDAERATALRRSAAEYVRTHFPASGHVRAVLGVCERAMAERDAAPARKL